jgi:hypothetical protein
MTNESKLRLDLNSPEFQRALFRLDKNGQRMVLNMLRKLLEMTWEQVYRDSGLRWEAILSKGGPSGQRLYSLRIGRGFRALASRDGDFLRLLSLHPDHESAYK